LVLFSDSERDVTCAVPTPNLLHFSAEVFPGNAQFLLLESPSSYVRMLGISKVQFRKLKLSRKTKQGKKSSVACEGLPTQSGLHRGIWTHDFNIPTEQECEFSLL
jgi:hypothetical protein